MKLGKPVNIFSNWWKARSRKGIVCICKIPKNHYVLYLPSVLKEIAVHCLLAHCNAIQFDKQETSDSYISKSTLENLKNFSVQESKLMQCFNH